MNAQQREFIFSFFVVFVLLFLAGASLVVPNGSIDVAPQGGEASGSRNSVKQYNIRVQSNLPYVGDSSYPTSYDAESHKITIKTGNVLIGNITLRPGETRGGLGLLVHYNECIGSDCVDSVIFHVDFDGDGVFNDTDAWVGFRLDSLVSELDVVLDRDSSTGEFRYAGISADYSGGHSRVNMGVRENGVTSTYTAFSSTNDNGEYEVCVRKNDGNLRCVTASSSESDKAAACALLDEMRNHAHAHGDSAAAGRLFKMGRKFGWFQYTGPSGIIPRVPSPPPIIYEKDR